MIERELIDYLLVNACNASIIAGKEIMKIYNSHDEFDVNIKSDNTIITEADRISHESIKRFLSQTRIPLLSEEGRNMLFEERYRWDLYWLVDPLDGTREFVKKNDEFVVCIALMAENKPLFGVIYVPAQQKLYFSDPDRGAFCVDCIDVFNGNGVTISTLFEKARKLSPKPYNEGDVLNLAVTKSHMNDQTQNFIDNLKKKYPSVNVVQCGSSLKFCYIAEGTAHMYVRMTSVFDWDVAAGHALVEAVGAGIKHLSNEPIRYNKTELVINPFITGSKQLKEVIS